MRELGDVLAEAEAAEAGQLPADVGESTRARLVRRVRNRRARRAAVRIGAPSAAVVLLGVVGLLAMPPGPDVVPSVTSSPSPFASASATPTPTPEAPAPAALQQVTVLGLGSLPQATAQTLAGAQPGWALIEWQPTDDTSDPWVPWASDLLLAAPDGTLYHLASFDSATSFPVVGTWTAGSSDVRVEVCPSSNAADRGACSMGRLDLLTGDVTEQVALPASEDVVEFLADGQAVLWGVDGAGLMRSDGRRTPIDAAGGVVVSPGGARAAWLGPDRVLRLADGSGPVGVEVALPPGDDECRVMAWIDTTSVLVSCMPADEGAAGGRFITVDVDAGTTTQVPITADTATWVGHRVLTAESGGVLYTGSVGSVSSCGSIQEWSAGTTRTFLPLTEVSELWGLGGGQVWFGTARTCTEIAPTSVEVLHADGTVTTVIAEDKELRRVTTVAGVSVAQP